MKTVLIAIAVTLATASGTFAATVVNKDAEPQVLMITEDGSQSEIVVEAGGTAEICPGGCFLTMPSGDRETLSGSETIDIVNGAAVIR